MRLRKFADKSAMKTITILAIIVGLTSPGAFAKAKTSRAQVTSSSSKSSSSINSPNPSSGGGSGSSKGSELGDPNENQAESANFDDPLKKTQELLESPELRKQNMERDPKAKHADDMVKQMTGGNESLDQEIYALASKVFANIAQQANGDPKVMQEILLKFQRDPAGFVGTWTPEQRARLKEIAAQMAPSVPKK